ACRHSLALIGSAYVACGEAGSALHAMALLQVHQAKALKDLYEGGHDPEVLKELRVTTDIALRATKVTARSLGRAMSSMVVQECHLWLCLTDMRETDKTRFLNAPVSQTGLFGDAVENFAQQFSAAQKQTESIRHILPRRAAAASTRPPAAAPQPARHRGHRSSTVEPVAGQPPRLSRPPLRPVVSGRARGPETDDPEMDGAALWGKGDHTTPSPGGGQGGESFVFFFFRHWPHGQWYPKTRQKSSFFYLWVPTGDGGCGTGLDLVHPPLSPVSSSGRLESAIRRTTAQTTFFKKVMEAALVPLKEQGIHILNYLDDWVILAQSRDQLCEHRDLVLTYLRRLGLRVNWEKNKLSPMQRISFLSMELDSAELTAHLTQERAQSVLNCLNAFKFQRLLGHMAPAAAVTPLGLLHMRP
ncbi:hypothetical protein M9458_037689, partial [Cirrhinus mrigala]